MKIDPMATLRYEEIEPKCALKFKSHNRALV